MSKIDVSPDDLKRWAAGLLEIGVSVRAKLEEAATTVEKAEVNRQKDDGFAAPRGATPGRALTSAVLNLESAMQGLGANFDRYVQSLTAALEGSASTVSTYDTNTGSSFRSGGYLVVRK